jgi:hypothetical protein
LSKSAPLPIATGISAPSDRSPEQSAANATISRNSLEQRGTIFYHIVQEIDKNGGISQADAPQLDQADDRTGQSTGNFPPPRGFSIGIIVGAQKKATGKVAWEVR